MSLVLADCVAKVFLAFGRETLIQDRPRTSTNDSKEPTPRFDCYKFLFHRACLATFATQSANSVLTRRSKSLSTRSPLWRTRGRMMKPSIFALRCYREPNPHGR